LDIEESPDDLLSDGEPEQNNDRGMEHSLPETDLDDESTLAEVINLMAPPPEPQERWKPRITHKNKDKPKTLKAQKGSRNKAKCADSESDNDDTQPWVKDPKGFSFKAIGRTFQLYHITDDESNKNIQAVVVDSILWEDKETNKQFNCLDYEFSRPGATTETDFATVEDAYIAIRATLWQ
jgi:hypothetical protein